MPRHASSSTTIKANDWAHRGREEYDDFGFGSKESKVAKAKRYFGKKGTEVYRWFA